MNVMQRNSYAAGLGVQNNSAGIIALIRVYDFLARVARNCSVDDGPAVQPAGKFLARLTEVHEYSDRLTLLNSVHRELNRNRNFKKLDSLTSAKYFSEGMLW